MKRVLHSLFLIMVLFTIVLLTSCKDYSKCIFLESSSIYLLPSEDGNSYEAYGVKDKTLDSYEIPNEYDGKPINKISYKAFQGCKNITSIVIPSNVTSIGTHAFAFCSRLTSVSLPEGIKELKSDAFCFCYNLISVTIPSSLEKCGDAFNNCHKLVEIYNLSSCYISLKDAVIHKSLDEESILIEDENGYIFANIRDKYYLLRYDAKDTNVVLPKSFNHKNETITNYGIYQYAFYESQIKSVEVPDNITSIGSNAFGNCTNLESAYIKANLKRMHSSIFRLCSNLKDVELPNGLTTIDGGLFEYCTSLTKINIPSTVTTIEYSAFKETGLKDIVIPDGVTSIEQFAFEKSKLESIRIPSSVKEIGYGVFLDSRLQDIYYSGTKDMWEQIDIDSSNNEYLKKVRIHFGS